MALPLPVSYLSPSAGNRRRRALRVVAASGAGCVAVVLSQARPQRSSPSQAFVPAPADLGAAASQLDFLPQLAIAAGGSVYGSNQYGSAYNAETGEWKGGIGFSGGATDASVSFDLFFYVFLIGYFIIFVVGIWLLSKPFFERRALIDKIQTAKMPFLLDSPDVGALDRYQLARLYIELKDFPAALGEFEEVEMEWKETREKFNPEDAMGALAARAQLHNSKGFALTLLEPARTAQARKEFVRAVTFWPEYPEALLNIANELMKRGRYDVAVRTLDAALKWLPGSEEIQELATLARTEQDAAMDQAAKDQAMSEASNPEDLEMEELELSTSANRRR